ncbi:MAG: hypothetical protein R3192_15890 [Woeseiaceae bacterium]|nr:hypothetical protein [Woeseiaceae bacterium]
MRKPIHIAMLASVAIHIALFVLLDLALDTPATPDIAAQAPVISIHSLNEEFSGTNENTENRAPTKSMQRVAAIKNIPQDIADAESDAAVQPSAKSDRRPADGLRLASARTAKMSLSQDSGVSRPEVVTSPARRSPIALAGVSHNRPPTFATAAMSRRQEKMLRRKIRDWSENLQKSGLHSEIWNFDDRQYRAEFARHDLYDDTSIERVTVTISTEDNGQSLSTKINLKRLAFSNYAQFVNRWDKNVQIHDDELDGRFHSNSRIFLSYSRKIMPQFLGQVTTSARSVSFSQRRGHVPRDKIFLGGLQTGVKAIRLPRHYAPFASEEGVAIEAVQQFDRDTRIRFFENGSFGWYALESGESERVVPLSDGTHFLLAGEDATLHVSGTVNGKVLVYSPQRIVIEGNLIYAADPAADDQADDLLGLVSEKYVDIAPPEVTGPGDILLQAAIYAKRRFSVRRFRSRGTALLHIYGSLTAGTLSATEPRFATKIQFDQRLENRRPPRFPMSDRYELESWEPGWQTHTSAPADEPGRPATSSILD